MMSRPYTYIMFLTLHLICRLWYQNLTLTLGVLHVIWSVYVDVKTLHLSWEPNLHLICRWWCQVLTLTVRAFDFIWSEDDYVETIYLPWTPCTSSDLQMMMTRPYTYLRSICTPSDLKMIMSWPYTYLGSLTLHLICVWWCQNLTPTMGYIRFI